MVLSVGRLKRAEERIGSEVSSKPRLDNTFSKFGEEREVRDGTIVGQILFVNGRLFEERTDNGVLEGRRERARRQRHVDDGSDCR